MHFPVYPSLIEIFDQNLIKIALNILDQSWSRIGITFDQYWSPLLDQMWSSLIYFLNKIAITEINV